ncbi:DUF3318 domain-containing protein [Anabaena sp. CS-542/02]|uniref:DUF3318 domain-containing protein n=1 Tax=Anabaena sp. CS-542/02 TaxID=3021719 RepID=UPI00232F8501|nr:DUF3318 domain-containing protein [Anabaena sp. CS-542/02]MDB9447873.1 DUF3318 domain-containing protein [Anabaena sp. CS-542/02]
MESKAEIRRLLNVIPASSRMTVKIVSKPKQPRVIDATFPLPWTRERVISINFNFWSSLPEPQRDLLILQKVNWLTQVKWFQPQIYQGVAIAGLVAGVMESAQGDVLGVGVATGLSAMALLRIWRGNKSSELELNADLAAIAIAQRRGYSESEAAEHLLSAIEAIAGIQKNGSLDFNELIRCQNLRAISNLSPVGIPKSI